MMRMRRMAENKFLLGLAGLGVLLLLAVAGLAVAQLNASWKLARVRTDFKAIWMASNAYGLDNCGINYAVDTAERRKSDPSVPLTFEWDIEARRTAGNFGGIGLTTPVAYLKAIPLDPFKSGSQYYDYAACDSGPRSIRHLALVRSVGPDGKPDLPLEQLRETLNGYYQSLPSWENYKFIRSSENRQWVHGMVAPYLYDPTNGSASGGDLVLVMNLNHEHYGYAWEPDSPDWRNLAPLSQPIEMGQVRLAPGWKVDQPVPPPSNTVEKKWTEAMITLPPDFVATFKDTSPAMFMLLTSRPMNFIPGVTNLAATPYEPQIEDRMNQLRNHLGSFEAFFAHPAPLTAPMDAALEKWRNDDPAWWASVGVAQPSRAVEYSGRQLHTYIAAELLVLYGKSKLLHAGRLAASGEGAAALVHIARLERLLSSLSAQMGADVQNGKVSCPGNPYLERIHGELRRLCAELRASIERQGAPVGGQAGNDPRRTGR